MIRATRGHLAGALAAVSVAAATALAVLAPASGAAIPAPPAVGGVPAAGMLAAAPIVTTGADGALSVDPATGLPPSGAVVAVQGSLAAEGFVMVCPSGAGAAADCLGAPAAGAAGPGWLHLATGGAFSTALTLPDAAECVPDACALLAGPGPDSELAVPLRFAPAGTTATTPTTPTTARTTATTPTAPTTPSTTAAPSTAIVQVVRSASIEAGGEQEVVFSGFQPGEAVALTLFSREVELPGTTADATGVVRAAFSVPIDLDPGSHRLQAVGQESGVAGVATFQVTAVPVSSSAPPSTTSSAPASTTPTATASAAPTTQAVTTQAPASVPTTTSAAAEPTTSSGSLWWLWLVLALVVIAAVVTGIVLSRRRQAQEQERAVHQAALAQAAEAERRRQEQAQIEANAQAPTAYLPPAMRPPRPPDSGDHFGLLSGREHPDSPQLYGGGNPDDVPTRYAPPRDPFPAPPPAPPSTGADFGPHTQAFRPDFGPHTQAFRPDFDDTEEPLDSTDQPTRAWRPSEEQDGPSRS